MEFIDIAVASLDEAQQVLKLGAIRPPANNKKLVELEAAIAPFTLPSSLRTFWERVDPRSVGEHHWRPPMNLDSVLRSWRQFNEQGTTPPLLLPFGYQSHCYVLVELGNGDEPGGSVFTGAHDDSELVREFDDLSGYLAMIATSLEAYATKVEAFDWETAVQEQWAIAPHHDVYGSRRRFSTELHEWLPHWKEAAGFDAEAEEAKGPTHTIDEVIAQRRNGPLTATIAARIVWTMGSSEFRRCVVSDGTGQIDVLIPKAVRSFNKQSSLIEFDIECPQGETIPLDTSHFGETQSLALSGDMEGAARAGVEGQQSIRNHPVSAKVVAMRYLPE